MIDKNKLTYYGYGMIALLLIWQALPMIIDLPIVPAPFDVMINLVNIFASKIMIHSGYSLWRIGAGVLLSIFIGVPIGLVMGYFETWDRFLSPITYLTYPIPKIALLPIVMLSFGLGELSKILMIVLIIIFQVIIAIRDGVKAIPKEAYYPLYSLGANNKDIFREIIFSASLPKFLTSLRIAMATAISVLFFTETFGTQYGMGYFIMDAWMRVNYLEMYSGIVVLSLIGLLLFVFIDFIERHMCSWQSK